jgi:hypothetical protein
LFAALLSIGDFNLSSWMVVICVGLAFFSLQLALTFQIYHRLSQQEKILKLLCRDFEIGGDGREDSCALSGNFVWLQWVFVNFPADPTEPRGNFSRESVLQELDTRIASNGGYLLLQRLGVMAPLLGVVLTVVGFYWLKVGEEEQSLQSILLAVTPLVSGVGTGAVLALINQALLHLAGRRVESLRMLARTWFDTVIWRDVGLDTQAATVKAGRAMERFVGSIDDAASRYAHNSNHINESTAAMKEAAAQFREVVQSFSAEIKGIPESLCAVRGATVASADALEELIRVGSRVVANLDVSVAAFRTTLDREFAAAARLHHQSGQVLAESVQQIGQATQRLSTGSDEWQKTAQANAGSFARMDESIRQHVVPGNRQYHDAVQGLTAQVAAMSKVVTALSSQVAAVAGEFDKVTVGLVPSVSSFCDAIDHRFGPAVALQSTQVESVGRSMRRLEEMAAGMHAGTTTLNALLHDVSQFARQTSATQATLVSAANNLADVGCQLRQSIESDVAPSQRALHEIATSFAETAAQLSDFTSQGVGPATRQLALLPQTLAGLEGAVAAIKNLRHARADVERLSDALARAAEISEAISALPEQLRDVLEQQAGHHTAATNSRGRFLTWLARRPR